MMSELKTPCPQPVLAQQPLKKERANKADRDVTPFQNHHIDGGQCKKDLTQVDH